MKTLVTSNQLYFRFDPQYNPYMNIRRIHNQLAYFKNKQTGIIMLFFLCFFLFIIKVWIKYRQKFPKTSKHVDQKYIGVKNIFKLSNLQLFWFYMI